MVELFAFCLKKVFALNHFFCSISNMQHARSYFSQFSEEKNSKHSKQLNHSNKTTNTVDYKYDTNITNQLRIIKHFPLFLIFHYKFILCAI